jgi:uncharacterized protein (TIGR00369 family)
VTTKRVERPESHDNCLLCGDTRFGLGLSFQAISEMEVVAKLNSNRHHQGYEGILHGGFVASLLDSAMCNALFNIGVEAVTGDMKIRFHEEIPYNSEVELIGRVISARAPLFKVEGELLCDGSVVASSSARFVRRDSRLK